MDIKKNVISFMNMKGGVGKTTLCVNLSDCLSREFNKKVLIIDFDPQANATQYLIDEETFTILIQSKRTVNSIYENSVNIFSTISGDETEELDLSPENLIIKVNEKLDLMAGNLALAGISFNGDPAVVNTLSNYLQQNNLAEKYDFVFIDCPPTHSVYTSSALQIANYYLMPVKPDFLSSIGIELFKRIIHRHNRTSPNKVDCLGIVFTLVQNYQYYLECKERIKNMNMFSVFENHIQQSSLVPKHAERHEFLYDISVFKSNIIELTREFLEKAEQGASI
ncbi:MAG TPA: hypothetical protein DDZ91_10050 [Firmicutes bacterium]|jgi:chromosome partitioning protein|nr:hypothetical protein [Bacillota bacterium]